MKRVLDLFCGVGGFSLAFLRAGWYVAGVDLVRRSEFGGTFIKSDVRDLDPDFTESFDAVLASPPCEEFARHRLPWLKGKHQNEEGALRLEAAKSLLSWTVGLCAGRECRIVECSKFAGQAVPGAVLWNGSWSLWGDVPLLLPQVKRLKTGMSGLKPWQRARVPYSLSYTVEKWFSQKVVDGRSAGA